MTVLQNNQQYLAPLHSELEQQLLWIIEVVQNLPEKTLHQPSATGGWSIASCLWHLNSYYAYYLPMLEWQLLHDNKTITPFKNGWLGTYFTRMMEPGKYAKKYAAFKAHIPPPKLSGYNVVYEFIQHHEKFITLLQQAENNNLNARIPISISKLVKLKIGDVLAFIIAHNKRHIQQAKRNLVG